MIYKGTNFHINYDEKLIDKNTLNDFVKNYAYELENIIRKFKIENLIIPLNFFKKEEFDEWVKENSISYKSGVVPPWLVGFSSSEHVAMVYPTTSNINNMLKIAIHESIHYILYNIYPNANISKLLDEGLATYFSKQRYNYVLKDIKEHITTNSLKAMSSLNEHNSIKFAENKGYSYCYFVIDFLLKDYDIQKILTWYSNNELFKQDIINLNLDERFKEYLIDFMSKINV